MSIDRSVESAASATAAVHAELAYRLLLVALVLLAQTALWLTTNAELAGDELRYLDQAERILAGTTPYPGGWVSNPPLYPAVLALLLKLGASVSSLKFVNVLAIAGATLLLHSLLCRFCTLRWSFALSCLFVFYPPLLMLGSQVMSEAFATLLLLIACRLIVDIDDIRRPARWRMLWLAVVLASLALFKPLFGYALAAACALALILYLIRFRELRGTYRSIGAAALLAIALCSPWLAYVHSLTGSRFSWGTTGGEHLYWMSIGGEDVWGSWVSQNSVDGIDFLVKQGHALEVARAHGMPGPEAQRFYAQLAVANIRAHPEHLLRNLVANAARVLFNYPFSFRAQSLFTYGYLLPNMAVCLCFALSLVLLPLVRRGQDPGLLAVMLLIIIYLGGNVLVGSTGRQAVVVIGPVLLWLAYQTRRLIDAGFVVPRPQVIGAGAC